MVVYLFKDHLKIVGLSALLYKTQMKVRGMPGMHFSLSPGTPTLILVEPGRVLTVRVDGSKKGVWVAVSFFLS